MTTSAMAHEQQSSPVSTLMDDSSDSFQFHPEWQVMLYNPSARKVVLFNTQNHQVSVRASKNDLAEVSASASQPEPRICELCKRPFPNHTSSSENARHNRSKSFNQARGMGMEYFKFLSTTDAGFDQLYGYPAIEVSDSDSGVSLSDVWNRLRFITASHATASNQASQTEVETSLAEDPRLPREIFNQGYYDRFFVEQKKLGRGLRGSVFLCQHVLNHVFLGEFAVKKVAVGDNKQWFLRMLREVHLLGKLRHSNIINYKHCWIEEHQMTVFGPPVPVLFILMECANGGNLEEYIEVQYNESTPVRCRPRRSSISSSPFPPSLCHAKEHGGIGLDEFNRKRRYLRADEIRTMLVDIVSGLDFLHGFGIVHRDLKPNNLLLVYEDPRDLNTIPRVLLSDFGECQEIGSPRNPKARTGATGTVEFMAPELLERESSTGLFTSGHSTQTDLWSLGMVLYYLAYSKLPYTQVDDVDQLCLEILRLKTVRFPGGGGKRVRHEVKALIQRLLSRNPQDRISTKDICRALEQWNGPNNVL